MRHRRTQRRRAVQALVAAIAVGGGLLVLGECRDARGTALPAPTPTRGLVARDTVGGAEHRLEDVSDALAGVAARVKPGVVYITAREALTPAVALQEGLRLPSRARRPGLSRPELLVVSSGSGFIVSADGYILTNQHVVDGARQVTVGLLDRREFRARVVGGDPATDVAVLKIDAPGLTPLPLGDSDTARVGDWVLAVGNPLGADLTFTVTSGIISAKGRTLELPSSSTSSVQDFIQTDAAINPGNSGGPLVNVRGEVIGINAAIASPTGSYAGYGFAVPIDLARVVMDRIVKGGRVTRAGLDVAVRDASPEDAEYVGLSDIRGVLVEDVGDSSSPARAAGIQSGDVILAVDGVRTDRVAQLQEAISFRRAGEVVSVDVARRGGARVTLRVPLQAIAPADSTSQDDSTADRDDADTANTRGAARPTLGITVAPLDDAIASRLRLPSGARGVAVVGVDDTSPAATHFVTPEDEGLDIITSLEGTPVTTPASLRAALGRWAPGDVVTLRVYNLPSRRWRIERVRVGGGVDK